MEILKKLNAPMKALGGLVINFVGKIFDATNPDGLSAVQSSSFEDAIAADVAQDQTSYAGALAGTAQIITGWAVVIFAAFGFVLGMKKPKTAVRRRRRKTTRRRTYKRRK